MNMQKEEKSRPLYTYVAILVVLIIINSLLAAFGEIHYPKAPGGVGLCLAVAFMIAFALWFGAWGAIAAYAGCFIGLCRGARWSAAWRQPILVIGKPLAGFDTTDSFQEI